MPKKHTCFGVCKIDQTVLGESFIIVIAVVGQIGGNESYLIYDIGICLIPRGIWYFLYQIYTFGKELHHSDCGCGANSWECKLFDI